MKIKEKKIKEKIEDFDLLVTFKEEEKTGIKPGPIGEEEIEVALDNSNSFFYIKHSEFIDVVTVELDMEPVRAVKLIANSPTVAIKKVVPIDSVVTTDMGDIVKSAVELASQKIPQDASFSVQCVLRTKRKIKSCDYVINNIAKEITRKLNLNNTWKNPDWVIQIEIIGDNTGIGICRREEILLK